MSAENFKTFSQNVNYGSGLKTIEECEADLKLNYTNPGHPIAFGGINLLYEYYNRKLNHDKIKNILSAIESYTLHKQYRKGKRNVSFSWYPRYQWQCDLVDVQELAEQNDGVRYLLTCIDTFTRFAWVRMLATKEAKVVLDAFKSILNNAREPPKMLVLDKGTEFTNKIFTNFCASSNILLRTPDSSVHAAYVERFNRTLQSLMYKYMTENETLRYIDKNDDTGNIVYILPNLVNTYNNRKHRMTGFTPFEAENNPNTHLDIKLKMSKYHASVKKRDKKFDIGDYVRISSQPGKFSRGYNEQSKTEIFKINNINLKMKIPLYILETFDGSEIIKGSFYDFELTKVSPDIFRIEKVLKTKKTRNGKVQHYVRWKGFSDKYDSWIDGSNIVKKF